MPLGDFAGNRNWGYDGVCLYAPARCYALASEDVAVGDLVIGRVTGLPAVV